MDQGKSQDVPAATPTEEAFRFPPINDKTLFFQLPGTGDVWMGFNPARFPLRVVLAWAAFIIEQYFFDFAQRVQAAQAGAPGLAKKKKSLMSIMSGGRIQ